MLGLRFRAIYACWLVVLVMGVAACFVSINKLLLRSVERVSYIYVVLV